MKWEVIFKPSSLALYAEGLMTTLGLLLSCLAVGAVLALLFALALTSRSRVLRTVVGAYTYVIRGTPLLIQLYLIYYGTAQLEWVQERWDAVWPWTHFKDPFFCALLAFSLNTAGYTAEMIAGAIRETAAGEIEAAQAMGMSPWQAMRRIVLPSALRRTLPAYSNEAVMMLHATSVASAVPAMLDVTQRPAASTPTSTCRLRPTSPPAALYLTVTFTLVGMFRLAERRYLAYLAPRAH